VALFGCHRRDGIRFAQGCGVRVETGEIYAWNVERPLPAGFRACAPDERASSKVHDEIIPACPIAGPRPD
jgi:hypothetical protein